MRIKPSSFTPWQGRALPFASCCRKPAIGLPASGLKPTAALRTAEFAHRYVGSMDEIEVLGPGLRGDSFGMLVSRVPSTPGIESRYLALDDEPEDDEQRKLESATELDRRDGLSKGGAGAGLPSSAWVACRLALLNIENDSTAAVAGGGSESRLGRTGRLLRPTAERCRRTRKAPSDVVVADFSNGLRVGPPSVPRMLAVGDAAAGVGEFSCSRRRFLLCGMGERWSPGEQPNMSASRSLAPDRLPSEAGDESASSKTSNRSAEGEAALSETERCCPGGRSAMGERNAGAGDSPSTSIRNGDDSGICLAVSSDESDRRLRDSSCGGGASWPAGAVCRWGLCQLG